MRRIGRLIATAPNTATPARTAITNTPMPRSIRLTVTASAFALALRSSAATINASVVAASSASISSPSALLRLTLSTAVVARRHGEFANDTGVAFDKFGKLLDSRPVVRIVRGHERGFDVPGG